MKKYFRMYRSVIWGILCCPAAALAQAVNVDTFEKGMQAPATQVFDVRTQAEYNTGHISGAMLADYTNKKEFEERVKYLDRKKPVYIYCLSGGRSSAAASWMRENDFHEVVEMEGGIRAWKQAGKALEGAKAEKQLTISEFRQSIQKGTVLVDVGAAWCPPCRVMEPVLQQFLQQHKEVQLVRVDGDKDQDVMASINAAALPTFIFYKDGKELGRKEGVVELAELEKLVK